MVEALSLVLLMLQMDPSSVCQRRIQQVWTNLDGWNLNNRLTADLFPTKAFFFDEKTMGNKGK